jgi:pyridoxamine 5'-phosphate oxidase
MTDTEILATTTDLQVMEQAAWQLMTEGKQNFKSEIHQFFVANCNDAIPELRTVILRGVNESEKWISFHSDFRSNKIAQLQQNNTVSALLYHHTKRMQLRLQCKASLHCNDDIADNSWGKARLQSKLSYSNALAPGTIIEQPILTDVNRTDVLQSEIDALQKNFVVVRLKIIQMDIVFLHHAGNKRMFINYETKQKSWLQP